MGWLSAVFLLIALLRIIFLLWGICICIHPLAHSFPICCPRNLARKVYCLAGFIYLAGLFPYSASFLTLDSWDNLGVDLWCYTFFRYLCVNCDIQMSACAFSSVLHMVMGLWTLIIYAIKTAAKKPLTKTQWYWRRWTGIVFLTPIAAFQGLSFVNAGKDVEGRRYPSDITDCWNRTRVVWTSPVVSDADEIIRLQMLLCEEKFSESAAKEYLILGVLVTTLCAFVLVFMYVGAVVAAMNISSTDLKTAVSALRRRKKRIKKTELERNEVVLLKCPEENEGDFQCSCDSDESCKEGQGMYLVSLMITAWVVIGKPLVVYLNSSYSGTFVDFGTHLLLTLSVLVPITYTKAKVGLQHQQV